MPRRCSCCAHPDRDALDSALVAGEAFRSVARRFALSPDAVGRHAKAHLPAAMALAHEGQAVAHGDDLLAQVRDLQTRTLRLLTRAEKGIDFRAAAGLIREARAAVELLARLAGQLAGNGVHVTVRTAPLPPEVLEAMTDAELDEVEAGRLPRRIASMIRRA